MSHFSIFDGGIVGIYLLATMTVGLMVRKYVGKVEHFIVAGREVNVYLGIASLAATEFGMVTCMYSAQNGYKYGFAGATPGIIYALAMGIVGLTGFCIKPMREAGVMTIPELFEKQFGPRIRWLAGVVIVLGGLLNMGVFLRMGGEFLVNVAGLNTGYLEITMTGLLFLVAVYTILGGMLSVLVTDFLQFVVMSAGLLVVTVLILSQVGWQTITDTVQTHCGSGGFNPFIHNDLGWPYIVFNLLTCTAAVLTWQTMVQRLLASRDSRTARKVYTRTGFFFVCRFLLPGIWGIAALAVLGPQQNGLLAMPKYLSTHVPIGLMGILIAAMLAADMSTNSSYMLSWGSVIYNDILRPIHRGLWTDRRGLLCNRLIVAAIGIFLLLFGLWYPLEEDLWVYLNLTGAIYFSSISMLLIACCYWKRANNWGAAGSIIFGAAIPIAFLVLQQVPATKHYADRIGPYYSGIAAFGIAALAMMVGSLIKPRSRTGVMER